MINGEKIKNVKKIAILRANALGDFIFALPAINAIKKTYSSAEIVYFGTPLHKNFLEGRPSPIDRVVVIPKSYGVRESLNNKYNESELRLFFDEIKNEEFDIALQMHGGGKYSNPFLLNLNHKISVGFYTKDAVKLDISIPYEVYQNEYIRYLQAALEIGAKKYELIPVITIVEKDYKEAKKFIPQKPFIVMHPGATDLRRRWSAANFACVADILSNLGYKIVFTGLKNEKMIIKNITKQMKHKAFDLSGKLSLSGLAGVLKLSKLVIANDTGPLHLSYAIGCSTIGLYWCGNGLVSAPLFRNFNNKILLSWIVDCPLCGQNCGGNRPFQSEDSSCKHEVSFVDGITPESVIDASLDILKNRESFTHSPVFGDRRNLNKDHDFEEARHDLLLR